MYSRCLPLTVVVRMPEAGGLVLPQPGEDCASVVVEAAARASRMERCIARDVKRV